MLFIVGMLVIVVITTVAIIRSKKPVKLILTEAKYELIFNALGSQGMIQDFIMRNKNKTDLPTKTGKVALICGGTRGIGLEVLKMLLKCDLQVILGCRNEAAGKDIVETLREAGITTGKVDVFQLDVSEMESVKIFAHNVKEKYSKIHYLINCAGIMFVPFAETKDGYESVISTNYFGPFLLTHLLLPEVKNAGRKGENARIINLSSCAHKAGDINFEDIHSKDQYIPAAVYAQSKLALILFTNYLNSMLQKEGAFVQVNSVHPGIVNTGIFEGTNLHKFAPWVIKLFKTPRKGAIPVIHTCFSPDLEDKGGAYIHNCVVYKTSHKAQSLELQKQLFDFSVDLLKINKFGQPCE